MWSCKSLNGKGYYLTALIIFLAQYPAWAQSKSELDYLLSPPRKVSSFNITGEQVRAPEISEFKFLFKGMIKMYQILLSSQQSPQICTFTPSCSHFGYQAIRDYGAFWGLLMTSDRFMRCHNFNYRYYKFDIHSRKLKDPVDIYYIRYWSH